MTFGVSGAVLAGVVAGGATLVSGVLAADAQEDASKTSAASAQAGIDETARQFDKIQELFKPFIEGGTAAFGQQGALLGLEGPEAEQAAIASIEQGPQFQALTRQGESAILQNASATGNLRGGNVKGALAQFRPNILSQLIQQRFQNLGGLSATGQASAAGQAQAGQQTGANIATLLGQQGAAVAGGQLAQANAFNAIPNAIGTGLGIFSGLGGSF